MPKRTDGKEKENRPTTAPVLYLILPCYNEEEVLPISKPILEDKMLAWIQQGRIDKKSRLLFVDDGSRDNSWLLIKEYCREELCCGIRLSRNRGQQNAMLAGLFSSLPCCDCAVTMDVDLQDDVEAVGRMVDSYCQGADIVYGARSARKSDSFLKRSTAKLYYRILQKFDPDIVYNHSEFRLMSKRAIEALSHYKEVNLFLRGIVPMIGYQTDIVTYERQERLAGQTKYNFQKLFDLAFDGITSLSNKPIRWIMNGGIIISLISFLLLLIFLIRLAMGKTRGITVAFISLWLLGGLILASLGLVGEYAGKTYLESKERPRYFIRERLLDEEEEE